MPKVYHPYMLNRITWQHEKRFHWAKHIQLRNGLHTHLQGINQVTTMILQLFGMIQRKLPVVVTLLLQSGAPPPLSNEYDK
jgi:hypothetical protein